jgi:hypothetical protein
LEKVRGNTSFTKSELAPVAEEVMASLLESNLRTPVGRVGKTL